MSEKLVSEKAILTEASRAYLPEDQLWSLLAELGIGTRELLAVEVREVVLKHAEANHWPLPQVQEVLARLGAQDETETEN